MLSPTVLLDSVSRVLDGIYKREQSWCDNVWMVFWITYTALEKQWVSTFIEKKKIKSKKQFAKSVKSEKLING